MTPKQQQRNRERARKQQERIQAQLKKAAGKGIEAATRFLAARVKETLSIPAPRKIVRAKPTAGKKLGAIIAYSATVPATPGAPPRLLSGRMRLGVTTKQLSPTVGIVGVHARANPSSKSPQGFNYPAFHETGEENGTGKLGDGEHPYLSVTAKKYRRELKKIASVALKLELKQSR